MTRYQALRRLGCDVLTDCFIGSLNHLFGVREGEIRFMHMIIEYDTEEQHDKRFNYTIGRP